MDNNNAKVIENLRELVSQSYVQHPTTPLHIRATSLITRLKSINRSANSTTRTRKDATAAARQEMDHSLLGLQNLLYEKRHLEREIEKCRQFASVYQDIPLYTLEEFTLLAPPELKTPEVLENDHQLMLNRLSFELTERQRLEAKRKQLAQEKETLLKESRSKVATLDSVKIQIDTLVKTASEIQKKVDELVLPIPSNTTSSTA